MSHNVFIKGVVFDDIEALQQAFAELVQEGKIETGARFHSNEFSMRGYGGRQAKVDAGIHLPSQPYDIGFKKNADGHFVPFFESGFHPAGIAAEPGSEDINGQACSVWQGAGAVGTLAQRYRVIQVERNAHKQGLMTRREMREKGQIALEVINNR